MRESLRRLPIGGAGSDSSASSDKEPTQAIRSVTPGMGPDESVQRRYWAALFYLFISLLEMLPSGMLRRTEKLSLQLILNITALTGS